MIKHIAGIFDDRKWGLLSIKPLIRDRYINIKFISLRINLDTKIINFSKNK